MNGIEQLLDLTNETWTAAMPYGDLALLVVFCIIIYGWIQSRKVTQELTGEQDDLLYVQKLAMEQVADQQAGQRHPGPLGQAVREGHVRQVARSVHLRLLTGSVDFEGFTRTIQSYRPEGLARLRKAQHALVLVGAVAALVAVMDPARPDSVAAYEGPAFLGFVFGSVWPLLAAFTLAGAAYLYSSVAGQTRSIIGFNEEVEEFIFEDWLPKAAAAEPPEAAATEPAPLSLDVEPLLVGLKDFQEELLKGLSLLTEDVQSNQQGLTQVREQVKAVLTASETSQRRFQETQQSMARTLQQVAVRLADLDGPQVVDLKPFSESADRLTDAAKTLFRVADQLSGSKVPNAVRDGVRESMGGIADMVVQTAGTAQAEQLGKFAEPLEQLIEELASSVTEHSELTDAIRDQSDLLGAAADLIVNGPAESGRPRRVRVAGEV